MQYLLAGLVWVLIFFMVLPPDLVYGKVQIVLTSGNVSGPLILSTVLVAGVAVGVSKFAQLRAVLREINPYFLGFIALATVSLLWTADPEATVRRLFRLYALVIGCIAFTLVGWHKRRFQNVVRPALTTLMVGSLIFGLIAPDLAIEQSEFNGIKFAELAGAWHGLAMQKNSLGAIAATATFLWAHAVLSRETGFLRALPGLAASVACLILSRSSTSLFATVFAVMLLALIVRPPGPSMRRFTPYLVGLFAALILVYSLAVLNIVPGLGMLIEPILALSGKDMTFSGRTLIWEIIKEQISLHPMLGIGYAAYWTGPFPTSPSYEFVQRTYVYPSESHNGYLDVVNELGFVGGACLLAYQLTFLRQGLRLVKFDRAQGGLYLGMLFQEFMGNLSEARWMNVGIVCFLLLALATASLARELATARLQGARAPGVPPAPVRRSLRPAWPPRRV